MPASISLIFETLVSSKTRPNVSSSSNLCLWKGYVCASAVYPLQEIRANFSAFICVLAFALLLHLHVNISLTEIGSPMFAGSACPRNPFALPTIPSKSPTVRTSRQTDSYGKAVPCDLTDRPLTTPWVQDRPAPSGLETS